MQNQMNRNKYAMTISSLYAGGLMVISLAFLQHYLSSETLDIPGKIGLLSFSTSLPLLAGILIVNAIEGKYPYNKAHKNVYHLVNISFIIGAFLGLLGIGATLWHILWIAGCVFATITIVAIIVYGSYIISLQDTP